MRETRMRLIGRGIVIGLCALACVVALSLHAERVAAAGYTVATTSDTGMNSLRDAITQVNAGAGTGDTITITATGTITLTSALPALNKNVAITGPGAAMLTVDGNHAVQGFVVNTGVTASIANLTIANGNGGGGGGIANAGTLTVTNTTLSGNTADDGGGIENTATLTVTNSTFSGNSAAFDGGGINNAGTATVTNSTFSGNSAAFGASDGDGGGILSSGTLTVTNSTFSGNTANNAGGGIYNLFGTLTVTNSTFSGNNTDVGGGGIANDGTATVTNSTLSGNSAANPFGGGGGIDNRGTLMVTNTTLSGNNTAGSGGGIFINGGTVTVTNTIVAGNTAGGNSPDIKGAVASHGHNLIGDPSGGSGFVASDLQNVNPALGALADNGGTTPLPDGSHVMTQAITSASPAFHAGDPTVCTAPFPTGANSQDERGPTFPRSTTACSIGAFEPQSAAVTITLSPTTLPAASGGIPYSQTLTATGGTAPYTFTVTTGTLPTGLSLSTGGLLSGTPTVGGTFSFTIQAKDANAATGSQAYTLIVTAPTITLSPTTLPNGTVGVAYSQTLTASGGTAIYTFTVTAGTLPTGLTLTTGGLLSGIPTVGGTFTFTIQAKDANGFTGMQQYTITVSTAAPPTITLSPTTLPSGVKGVAYPATTLAAAGGTAPYTFAVTTGTLPTGLMLSSSGLLSGTPTAGGTFTFTVTATDANGFTGMQQYTITVSTTASPTLKSIAFTGPGGTPPPTTLKVGQNVAITATGTYSDGSTQNLTGQVQWSSSNPQVAMVDANGKVTGESPGTVTITATLNGVSQTFTVTVGGPTPIGITVQPAPASRPGGANTTGSGAPAPAPLPLGR